MDFVGGALPNVMFIAGLLAIGIGLGIEFKIVEVKGQLNKQSRFGAIGIGLLLIVVSVVLYTRPPQTASAPAASQPAAAQANVVDSAPQSQPTEPPAPTQAPTATPIPPTEAPTATPIPPTEAPTATPVPPTEAPTATPIPPTEAPTATPIPPTEVPGVAVPDIRKKNTKDAEKMLKEAGLRLGDRRGSCDDIGASPIEGKLKRDQIRCQSPAPGSTAALDEPVSYVIGEAGDEDD